MAAPWYEARLASGNSLVGRAMPFTQRLNCWMGVTKQEPPTSVQIGTQRPGERLSLAVAR